MGFYDDVICMHCGTTSGNKNVFSGCPQCKEKGYFDNYEVVYNYNRLKSKMKWPFSGRGLWKYKPLLPILSLIKPFSIHEGGTPLIHLKKLGEKLGLSKLYLKDESRNPTWSYKDRLCSVAITRAVQDGAKVITASS